ncbi:MAG: SAM-dependent chlorinase/fluorinase [Anaerolineaceae bacterium]|nr:SAM-dependent chlorinase/fluorinase [Anaerolineaceae bacterium]
MRPVIAILTDFGTRDPFIAIMKGVMRRLSPNADFIDVTHDIEAQNVRQAAFTLLNSWRWFPSGTIFLCVVDPGVGSERRALVASAGGCHFVAPDNGLLSWTLAESPPDGIISAENSAWYLENVSHTFHGRDIFAPLAAHLACGVGPGDLGPAISGIEHLPEPRLEQQSEGLHAEVVDIDRFGNLVSSVGDCRWREDGTLLLSPRFGGGAPVELQADKLRIGLGDSEITGVRKTYSDVAAGELLSCVGSSGFLESGINQGNAARELGIAVGDTITLGWTCNNS